MQLDDYEWKLNAIRANGVKYEFKLKPERVIYNDPATAVIWSDGSKTVVKCHEGDAYDKREGFLLCCAKRLMGNTGKYNDLMAGVPDHEVRAMAWIGR